MLVMMWEAGEQWITQYKIARGVNFNLQILGSMSKIRFESTGMVTDASKNKYNLLFYFDFVFNNLAKHANANTVF